MHAYTHSFTTTRHGTRTFTYQHTLINPLVPQGDDLQQPGIPSLASRGPGPDADVHGQAVAIWRDGMDMPSIAVVACIVCSR